MPDFPLIPTILVGDTHAELEVYRALLERAEGAHGARLPSVHVGDYGFSYLSPREMHDAARFHRTHRRHRFIRGNHDAPEIVRSAPGYLPDGSISGRVLFLGSADGSLTHEDTELDSPEMQHILAALRDLETRPTVVVSHDAPQVVAQAVHDAKSGRHSPLETSRTRRFLSDVHLLLQPALWIFGHWHHAWEGQMGPTHFRGMGFQECFTMELPWDPKADLLVL